MAEIEDLTVSASNDVSSDPMGYMDSQGVGVVISAMLEQGLRSQSGFVRGSCVLQVYLQSRLGASHEIVGPGPTAQQASSFAWV